MATLNHICDGVNLQESQEALTFSDITPFAIIAILSSISRFTARKIQKLRFEFDDWMIVVALVWNMKLLVDEAHRLEFILHNAGFYIGVFPLLLLK